MSLGPSATLQTVGSASNDKYISMLVNAVLTDNHEDARMAQAVIQARSGLENMPEYTANIDRIASGLTQGKQRDSKDVGIV